MNEKDLIDAIIEDNKDKFWSCIRDEVNPNSKTPDEVPMLILAVIYERYKLIWYLLHCGANLDATDKDGRTAMDWANKNGDRRARHLLKRYREIYPVKTKEQLDAEIYVHRDPTPKSGSTVRRRRTHAPSPTPPAITDGGAGGGGAGAGPIIPRDVEPEQTSLLATLFGMFGVTPTRYEPDLKDHRSGEKVRV